MKRILFAIIIASVAWKAFTSPTLLAWTGTKVSPPQVPSSAAVVSAQSAFMCDGRQYCSQMTSCAEAKNFLQHCSGMKMDGDGDGIPCESQWCN
ncbi:MAG: excalibur calcium-binding domain-containing protein [Pseudomonas sp.]